MPDSSVVAAGLIANSVDGTAANWKQGYMSVVQSSIRMSSDCGKLCGTRDYIVEDFPSPPTRVVWSPLFENSPGRNYSMRVRPSSLKDLSISSDGELPAGWRTAEEQQRNLLSRKYLSPRGKHSGKDLGTSSDEDSSRSWKAAKLSYPGVQFATAELERHPHVKEHLGSGTHVEGKERRRFSEGSYGLRYGNLNVVSSRQSDSDNFCRGMKTTSSLQLVEEGEVAPEARVDVCRKASSMSSEGTSVQNLPDVLPEESSESELKRTRMESTGNEAYTKQRRSKIRVLEESDLNSQWNDASGCGIGSGGIGRGRVVKGKDVCTANGEDLYQHLVRESHSEVGRKVSISDDQEDFIQKCRNWSVADSYINVDGKVASGKFGRFEDGSDRDSEFHETKPHRQASSEAALDVRRGLKWSTISDPVTASPSIRVPKVDTNRYSVTDQSSSDLGSNTDSQSPNSDELSKFRQKDVGQRHVLIKESVLIGKTIHEQPEGKARWKFSSDDRCNLSQGSDAAKSCRKSSFTDSGMKTRKARYDSAASTVTTDREKDMTGGSLKELRRKRKSLRKRRSQSPTAAVACAASMIGDTVEAVRKVREDAAELAFKLAELHAHDAKALRSAAAVMRHHVDCLHTEVHCFQTNWGRRDVVEFPWHSFLRELLVAASMVSGVFSVQACINSVRRALGSFKQTASRREKVVLAAVLLTVGARFGTGVYQGLGQVKSVRRARDKQLREHLKYIMERTSLLSTLAHTDPTSSPFETSTEVEDERQSMVYCR